jgi:glucose-6-phosphate isomerase
MARSASSVGFKDKMGIASISNQIVGLGDWMEQLIAESTGKIGRGVLPIVLDRNSPELKTLADDFLTVGLVDKVSEGDFDIAVSGSLGSQLLLWEVATVVAAKLLGVNPFDQPDVESAKVASRAFLENKSANQSSLFTESGIEVFARNLDLGPRSTLREALRLLLDSADKDSYFAIHAYLDRNRDVAYEKLRGVIAGFSARPTNFGWGPRFLHSTGQYHKGGPAQGVFLQLIGTGEEDIPVPGRDFGFAELMNSQAVGDANVLSSAGRPVLALRFADKENALALIQELIQAN